VGSNRPRNVYAVAQASLSGVSAAVFTLRDDKSGAARRRCTCPKHEGLRPGDDGVAIPPGAPARSPPPRASSPSTFAVMELASVVRCVGLLTAIRLGRAMGDFGPTPARVPMTTVRRSQS